MSCSIFLSSYATMHIKLKRSLRWSGAEPDVREERVPHASIVDIRPVQRPCLCSAFVFALSCPPRLCLYPRFLLYFVLSVDYTLRICIRNLPCFYLFVSFSPFWRSPSITTKTGLTMTTVLFASAPPTIRIPFPLVSPRSPHRLSRRVLSFLKTSSIFLRFVILPTRIELPLHSFQSLKRL